MDIRRAEEKDIPGILERLGQVLQIHAAIRPDIFIDDLCVDQRTRGQHVGESLFDYVKAEARKMGCYEVTLNVWAGNTAAEKFYDKMGMRTKERQMEYIL